MQHNLYLIAGCNGAGKTTASFRILEKNLNCDEFVNADSIAWALSPFKPESVAFEAGRIMLRRINELLEKQVDFALETTLSSRTYLHLIERAKAMNYRVNLVFFWLPFPEMAFERVCSRFAKGGHFIPEAVVHRRYKRGLQNLFELYMDVCDLVLVYDNSNFQRELIATKQQQENLQALDPGKWEQLGAGFLEENDFYLDEQGRKIDQAMKNYYRQLVEETIRGNSYLLVADEFGKIKRMYADELQKELEAGRIGQL